MIKRATLRQLKDSGQILRKMAHDTLRTLEEKCWGDSSITHGQCIIGTDILRAAQRHVISINGWWSREMEPSTCQRIFYEPRGFDRCAECGNERSSDEACRRCYLCHKPLCEMCITKAGICTDCYQLRELEADQ